MTSNAVSFAVKPMSIAVIRDITAVASWVRIPPFGLPVVPEVYISAHTSSAPTSASRW
jgi:hypothetical protein